MVLLVPAVAKVPPTHSDCHSGAMVTLTAVAAPIPNITFLLTN